MDAGGAAIVQENEEIGGDYGAQIVQVGGKVYSGTGKIIDPLTLTLEAQIATNGPRAQAMPVPALDRIFITEKVEQSSFSETRTPTEPARLPGPWP